MDGTATMAEIGRTFRTPVRILLPKLLKSRDDWKAKSHQRKTALKAATIKSRDLTLSRQRWRDRAEQLDQHNQQLQDRLDRAERELEQTRVALAALTDAQKK